MQNHFSQKTVNFSNTIRSMKSSKMDSVLHSLGIQKACSQCLTKAGFASYFTQIFVDVRKVDLSIKLLERFLVFFRYIFSYVIDVQLYQV